MVFMKIGRVNTLGQKVVLYAFVYYLLEYSHQFRPGRDFNQVGVSSAGTRVERTRADFMKTFFK